MTDTATMDFQALTAEAIGYLRDLLRIDTTNPPGDEAQAARYIAGVLREAGFEPAVLESAPGRGNVVARYPGTGEEPPFLIYGHTDVVRAEPEHWTKPPFSGDVEDGCIWGRGALDMKSMVAQELMIMVLLQRAGFRSRRDIIFAATADEEAGGAAGIGFLVDHHPDLIRAQYALSEGGGVTTYLAGRPYYDVRVAEKGTCRFNLRARGEPGHGSVPRPQTAVSRIAHAVTALVDTPLPFHWTPALEAYYTFLCDTLNIPARNRELTARNVQRVTDMLPPALRQYIHAITHNTAVPTGLRAGHKINVIPSEANAWVDGRYLPGTSPDDFLREVRAVLGDGFEIEPIDQSDPVQDEAGGPLYETILSVMRRHAPGVPVVPTMMTGATDAKHVSRLGASCLGFNPIKVDESFPADSLVHGHDERVPIDGYMWGLRVLYDIVTEFSQAR